MKTSDEYAQNNADRSREYAGRLGARTIAILRGAATSVAGIVTNIRAGIPDRDGGPEGRRRPPRPVR
jgi:hypothetical protein